MAPGEMGKETSSEKALAWETTRSWKRDIDGMDADYFRQIQLPFQRKAEIMHGLLRFILLQGADVPRGREFDQKFIDESSEPGWLKTEAENNPWLVENVGRIFWICCSLGLLKYQYPYPHRGQTYRPTRAARWFARTPEFLFAPFLGLVYAISVVAGPVAHFKRIRNAVGVATAGLLWWRQHDLWPVVILYVSIFAGAVSAWIAKFLASHE